MENTPHNHLSGASSGEGTTLNEDSVHKMSQKFDFSTQRPFMDNFSLAGFNFNQETQDVPQNIATANLSKFPKTDNFINSKKDNEFNFKIFEESENGKLVFCGGSSFFDKDEKKPENIPDNIDNFRSPIEHRDPPRDIYQFPVLSIRCGVWELDKESNKFKDRGPSQLDLTDLAARECSRIVISSLLNGRLLADSLIWRELEVWSKKDDNLIISTLNAEGSLAFHYITASPSNIGLLKTALTERIAKASSVGGLNKTENELEDAEKCDEMDELEDQDDEECDERDQLEDKEAEGCEEMAGLEDQDTEDCEDELEDKDGEECEEIDELEDQDTEDCDEMEVHDAEECDELTELEDQDTEEWEERDELGDKGASDLKDELEDNDTEDCENGDDLGEEETDELSDSCQNEASSNSCGRIESGDQMEEVIIISSDDNKDEEISSEDELTPEESQSISSPLADESDSMEAFFNAGNNVFEESNQEKDQSSLRIETFGSCDSNEPAMDLPTNERTEDESNMEIDETQQDKELMGEESNMEISEDVPTSERSADQTLVENVEICEGPSGEKATALVGDEANVELFGGPSKDDCNLRMEGTVYELNVHTKKYSQGTRSICRLIDTADSFRLVVNESCNPGHVLIDHSLTCSTVVRSTGSTLIMTADKPGGTLGMFKISMGDSLCTNQFYESIVDRMCTSGKHALPSSDLTNSPKRQARY